MVRATGKAVFEFPGDVAAVRGTSERAVEPCAPAGPDRSRPPLNFRAGPHRGACRRDAPRRRGRRRQAGRSERAVSSIPADDRAAVVARAA